MTARQSELFGARPRKAPRVLMHVVDAGNDPCGGKVAEFLCGRCGHRTGWTRIGTVTEAKRGLPCPSCNPAEPPDT